MSARRERKKMRREERENRLVVKSFKDFGQTTMAREINEMDEKRRREIMSNLDEEAQDAFRGLMKITEKAVEQHIQPDTFDSVRQIMTYMRADNYKQAYRVVKDLVGTPNLQYKVRSLLVQIGHDIAALARDKMGTVELRAGEADDLISKINERLSEVTGYAAHDADSMAEADFDAVGQIEINLPSEVEEPTIVDKVTLLVLPDRKVAQGPGVRPLASGVYLIEATLIGIPSETPEEQRQETANRYAMRQMGATVTPISLSRPDSDGIWYPVFKQRFAAEIVQFPDQARRYYGSTSAMNEVAQAQLAAKSVRLRALREQFERDNADLLQDLTDAQRYLDDLDHQAKEASEAYRNKTGYLITVQFSTVEAKYRTEHEADLFLAGDDLMKRFQLNKAFKARMRALEKERNKVIALRVRIKHAKKAVEELEAEVADRKAQYSNPYAKVGKRVAQMGRQTEAA